MWNDFHAYWFQSPQKVPTYFITYEDLLSNPKPALIGLVKFLLGVDTLENTQAMKDIETILGEGKTVKSVYKPRSGKINANKKLYSKA